MSIFTKLKTHLQSKKQTTFERYVSLLERAESPQDGDAEALDSIMGELGLSIEQVQADAQIVKDVEERKPHILDAENRSQRVSIAQKAYQKYISETESLVKNIIDERQSQHDRLLNEFNVANGQMSISNSADHYMRSNIGILKYKRLYPTNPLNLHD